MSNFKPTLGLFQDTLHTLVLGVKIPLQIVMNINNGTNQSFKLGLIPGVYTGRVPLPRLEATTLRVPKNDVSPSTSTA